MRAHYQYSWLKEPDSDDLSQFSNWEVRAEITVRPPGGWVFSTNGFYRSNTRSLYRNTKDIYTIGARIAKEFKRFTVYLEGQDLLDHPVTTESSSQDRSQLMVQKMNMNRRLFLLGLTININE
jgi:hypothetical protein